MNKISKISRQLKRLLFLSPVLVWSCVFSTGCAGPPVNVKDEVITTSLGNNGGQDVDMFTKKTSIVPFTTIMTRWTDLSNIQVMLPITAIEDFENELASLCTDYDGGCTETVNDGINQVIAVMKMIRGAATNENFMRYKAMPVEQRSDGPNDKTYFMPTDGHP